jgi:hypothetical protein
MIKLTSILREILNKPLPWQFKGELGSGKIVYKFEVKTEDKTQEYLVYFGKEDEGVYNVSYMATGHTPQQLTGQGASIQVLSTVTDIIKDFLSKFGDRVDKLVIDAAKTEQEREAGVEDSKRFRVYTAMIERLVNPKEYNVAVTGDNQITITKKHD